jgi:hypothetical protein
MENRENEERIDRILGSLDEMQKAPAPDYFYTRLTGRMQSELEAKRKPGFVLRPVLLTAALSVVLLLNIFFLTQENKQPAKNSVTKEPATIESFAKAYDLNGSSLYE